MEVTSRLVKYLEKHVNDAGIPVTVLLDDGLEYYILAKIVF